jgi:glutathione S-transferase
MVPSSNDLGVQGTVQSLGRIEMRIYDFKGFPNPTRVRIALAEKNLMDRVEFTSINLLAGEHRCAPFLAKNPFGLVPVLELEDGTTIAECAAITEYLDHIDGRPTLTGTSVKDRARIHMMQRRVEASLLDAAVTYFHHATPGLGPDLETYQNREWGEKSLERAQVCMKYLDQLLSMQPYLAGDQFSVADITAFVGLTFSDSLDAYAKSGNPSLRAWQARIADRPSISAVA